MVPVVTPDPRRRHRFLVAIVCACAAGCSSGSSPSTPLVTAEPSTPPPSSAASPVITAVPTASAAPTVPLVTANVTLEHVAFAPAALTVAIGTTVVWSNQDSIPHTVTADDASFDSGRLAGNKSFRQTFSKTGTYAYHCSIHQDMKGTIVVK